MVITAIGVQIRFIKAFEGNEFPSQQMIQDKRFQRGFERADIKIAIDTAVCYNFINGSQLSFEIHMERDNNVSLLDEGALLFRSKTKTEHLLRFCYFTTLPSSQSFCFRCRFYQQL